MNNDKLECPYCFNTNPDSIYVSSYTCSNYTNKFYVVCHRCGLWGSEKTYDWEAIEAFKMLINKNFIGLNDE